YWLFNSRQDFPGIIKNMSAEIAHRGPDDEGFVLINTGNKRHMDLSSDRSPSRIRARLKNIKEPFSPFPHDLAMAHRRFAIIDVSPSGHQPMWDEEKSLCVVFNGEILNYLELRGKLQKQGFRFRTRSDTEVILKAYQCWGEGAFERFSGFWGISLYDMKANRLILSRDRIGKKPLYIYKNKNGLVWASEIKSILKMVSRAELNLDDEVIFNYLVSGIKDVNHSTFWKDIRMMDNAMVMQVRPDGLISQQYYWTLPDRRMGDQEIDFGTAANRFKKILEVSLTERLRADVPIAFELSGGLDSSSLVAFRSVLEKNEFSVFTVKYDDKSVDESEYAIELASRYSNINHHLINFEEENLWDYLEDFIYLMEEPFHGPVLLIGQLLRRKMRERGCKVIIGGAGGDEIFAGYTEYAIPTLRKLWKKNQYIKFLKNLIFYKEKYPLSFFPLARLVLQKLFHIKQDPLFFNRYLKITSRYNTYLQYPRDVDELYIQNMKDLKMYYWMSSNDKSDMGIPIEVRNPFLDHRVVEYLYRLPVSFFFQNGWLKWFLRKSFEDILPESILWRKRKQGFPFPLDKWLLKNRRVIKEIIYSHDNHWIRNQNVIEDYQILARENPGFLWRMINYQLWVSTVVYNQPTRLIRNGE
ncbi:MAG: asparagine synthase (glutamine-hydrolyzing), partial [Candidatus Aminicenantes bacterium]|nr:asparagine synthase (glutamine-hydrolyzing) [Candidatus Aminicenantes bacterium]